MNTNSTNSEQQNTGMCSQKAMIMLECISAVNLNTETLEQNLPIMSSIIGKTLGASSCCIILKNSDGKLKNIFGDNIDLPRYISSMVNAAESGKSTLKSTDTGKYICSPIKTHRSVYGVILAESDCECFDRSDTVKALELCGMFVGLKLSNLILAKACDANERLATAGRAILDLSHSVKNILQMTNGAADVIDLGLKTNQLDRVRRNWEILKPNLDRLRKFMLDMLDYSKDRPLVMSECDFNKMIQDAIDTLKTQLKQKVSQLSIQIDQKMPAVQLDCERILEMALNIILNAVDIVDDEDGIVCVETQYDKDKHCVILRVTDNGPGMDDEMKSKLFVPFESGKNKFGTGLGMAIAKRVIDSHKGKIEVDSQLNVGTTVTVTLPARVVE